jgi:hypothetical protein
MEDQTKYSHQQASTHNKETNQRANVGQAKAERILDFIKESKQE